MPTPSGYCLVTVQVQFNGLPVPNAIVDANLVDQNSMVAGYLVSMGKISNVTDDSGVCTILLIQRGTFTRGSAAYRVLAHDGKGRVFFDTILAAPNASSANLADIAPL